MDYLCIEANCYCLRLSVLDTGAGTRQTDRRMDGQRRGVMSLAYAASTISVISSTSFSLLDFNTYFHATAELRVKQEAELSQRDRATLRVIEYFAKSPKVTQGHSQ